MRILLPKDGWEWDQYLSLPRSTLFSEAQTEDFFDLAVILPEENPPRYFFRCGTLLLWEGTAEECLHSVKAQQVVSCGFSARNTLTPASIESGRVVITVQREIRRPDGSYVWPQDIPLPERWGGLSLPKQMVLTGLRLLGAEE